MKKLFFTLIALFAVFTASARHNVELMTGNLGGISGKAIYFAFDYSKMQIFDEDSKKYMTETEFCQMKGEDFVRDQGKDTEEAEAWFIRTMTEQAKKYKVVDDPDDADFVITVAPTVFSYGNPNLPHAAKAFMSNKVDGFFTGDFFLTDKNGTEVARMHADTIVGEESLFSWTIAKNYVYVHTAKKLAKLLNSKGK